MKSEFESGLFLFFRKQMGETFKAQMLFQGTFFRITERHNFNVKKGLYK